MIIPKAAFEVVLETENGRQGVRGEDLDVVEDDGRAIDYQIRIFNSVREVAARKKLMNRSSDA